MAMRFEGTLDELIAAFDELGIHGRWQEEPNGVFMVRCSDGANVHWSSTRKSLWVDGNVSAQRRLLEKIEVAVAAGQPTKEVRRIGRG